MRCFSPSEDIYNVAFGHSKANVWGSTWECNEISLRGFIEKAINEHPLYSIDFELVTGMTHHWESDPENPWMVITLRESGKKIIKFRKSK